MGTRKRGNGGAGIVYLDTHAAVWLAEGDTDWLSAKAREAVARGDLRLSPMVVLELEMLHENRRLDRPATETVNVLRTVAGVEICDAPWIWAVDVARRLHWTRDPFDRLIVGHAAAQEAPLITMDRTVLTHYVRALC